MNGRDLGYRSRLPGIDRIVRRIRLFPRIGDSTPPQRAREKGEHDDRGDDELIALLQPSFQACSRILSKSLEAVKEDLVGRKPRPAATLASAVNQPARIRRLTLVAVALAAAAWFVFRSSNAPGLELPTDEGSAPVGQDEPVGGEARELLSSAEHAGASEGERMTTRVEALAQEDERREQLPADAIWIEGRVRVPVGTPADEGMRVVAHGRRFMSLDKRRTHETRVKENGSFRVAFAPKTRRGSLELRARFSYLESKLRLELPLSEAPVVLEPVLGACVLVDLILPPELERLSADPIDVTLRSNPGGSWCKPRCERLGAGRYEIGGVPPQESRRLHVASPVFVDCSLDVQPLAPGQTLSLEVRPRPGVRITGRVVDETGAAIAEAELSARSERGRTETQSDSQGGFALAGIPPGDLSLKATHARHFPLELVLGEAADGDEREDLRLVLPTGESLAGRVALPDGEPVAGAKIEVVLTDSEEWSVTRRMSGGETDREGRYRLTGLHRGEYWVRASLEGEPLDALHEARLGDQRVDRWTEEREAIVVPGPKVDFVVQAGHELRVRVVDDRGLPIHKYSLSLLAVDLRSIHRQTGDFFELDTGRIGRWRVQSESGGFVVHGVPNGEWELLVSAREHSKAKQRVRIPAAEGPVLKLTRDARLSGTVAGPGGVPIEQATVEVSRVSETKPRWESGQSRAGKTETSKTGRFKFRLSPGEWSVRAKSQGRGASQPWKVTLGPGQVVENARLTLSDPGSVHVTLHSDFAIRGESRVKLSRARGGSMLSVKLRPGESRELEDLDAGEYWLTAYTDHIEYRGSIGRSHEEVFLREEFSVNAGERVEVVLGRPSSDYGNRARGRVSRCGESVAGVRLQWRCIETGWVGIAQSNRKGEYELGLAGKSSFEVRIGNEDQGWSSHGVDLEQRSEFVRDFDLPCGSISGFVLDDTGTPMDWVEVSATRREPGGWSSKFKARTGSDGRFSIGPLEAGTYSLLAKEVLTRTTESGGSFRVSVGIYAGRGFGQLRVDGVRVSASGPTEDLELHLPQTSTVHVRAKIRGAGNAAGARLSLSYADGLRTGLEWVPTADVLGRADIHGLGPGDYLLHATLNDSESERAPVSIAGGERVEIELTLSEGE